jgi:DNA-directed RNA polymerase beta' subunit
MQQNVPLTGPAAIQHALSKINLDGLREKHLQIIKSGAKSKRTKSVQALNAIEGLKRNNLTPDKLLVQNVPVIPPAFRPFSVVGNTFVPGDANELYRDLFQYKDIHNETEAILGAKGAAQAKLDLYDTVKALYGYGTPIAPKTKQRGGYRNKSKV